MSCGILLPALQVLPVRAFNLDLTLITLNEFKQTFSSCTLMMNNMSWRANFKQEAMSLVDDARDDIESEEEAEEQFARDQAQWVLELDTCWDGAICQLAGLFSDAEQVSLQSQASEPQLLERTSVGRSHRLAALPRVNYALAKKSAR